MMVAQLFCEVGTMDPHKMFVKFLELLQEKFCKTQCQTYLYCRVDSSIRWYCGMYTLNFLRSPLALNP